MAFEADITLKREQFQLKETIATIITEDDEYIETAKKEIQKCRSEIEQFIRKDNFFEVSLKPYNCSKKDPEIIKKMCDSSKKLNVSPMATVAGVIAEYAVKAMISKGAKHAIVDNGGDIAKLAFNNNSYSDVLSILKACSAAHNLNYKFTVMGLGPLGYITRVLGPAIGCEMVYTSLAENKKVVEGQVDIKTLREMWNTLNFGKMKKKLDKKCSL